MTSLDRFSLICLAVLSVLMLVTAAAEYYPGTGSPSEAAVSQPVTLWRAEAVTCADPDDFVCVLHAESLAKARPTKGRGYSERERNEMNQLIARLP